jgi:hypothetical protein
MIWSGWVAAMVLPSCDRRGRRVHSRPGVAVWSECIDVIGASSMLARLTRGQPNGQTSGGVSMASVDTPVDQGRIEELMGKLIGYMTGSTMCGSSGNWVGNRIEVEGATFSSCGNRR